MTLQIVKNIEAVSKRILGDPGNGIPPDPTLANDIARDGIKAIFAGMGPIENGVVTTVNRNWETLMKHFAADNSRELERLCGKDRTFNGSDWGFHCLAYIAGDSVCTSETTLRGGTKRSMSEVPGRRMLENLDAEDEGLATFVQTKVPSADTSNDADAGNLSDTDSSVTDTDDKNK